MCLTSFGPVLVVPNLLTPSLLDIPQGLGVGMTMDVGCQVVAVAVGLLLLLSYIEWCGVVDVDASSKSCDQAWHEKKKTSIS